MAHVAKVVTIIGSSPESFAKAADVAVQEAAKTIRGISGAHVVEMSATVEDGRISQYRTTVNIAFAVEHWGLGETSTVPHERRSAKPPGRAPVGGCPHEPKLGACRHERRCRSCSATSSIPRPWVNSSIRSRCSAS